MTHVTIGAQKYIVLIWKTTIVEEQTIRDNGRTASPSPLLPVLYLSAASQVDLLRVMSISSWNVPPPTYDAHSTITSLTPYLQLPHLLSLTWLAYPILSLIFVAFRLQLSLASAQDAVLSAKNDLLASCKAAEDAATSTASMPRYLALATNKQYADAVNASMNAARAALVLSLTVMEAIINFIIDIYRSTFLCFLEFVVRGGLSILIGAVQEVPKFTLFFLSYH